MNKAKLIVFIITISSLTSGCFDNETSDPNSPSQVILIDPWVQITYPAPWSQVSGEIEIRMEAGPPDWIEFVVLYVDGLPVDSLLEEPFAYAWNTATLSGDHTIFARAGKTDDYLDSPLITVSIIGFPDTEPPYVRITSPADWTEVQGLVPVQMEAVDNEAVERLELLLDGNLSVTLTTSPYSWNWEVTGLPEANHTLMCRAYDLAGNLALSNLVTVTVANP